MMPITAPRRSSRQRKTRVSSIKEESGDEDDFLEVVKEEDRHRRQSSPQSSSGDPADPKNQDKKRFSNHTRKKRPAIEAKGEDDNDNDELMCPHCGKEFRSHVGRQYHVEHGLCRRSPTAKRHQSVRAGKVSVTRRSEANDSDDSSSGHGYSNSSSGNDDSDASLPRTADQKPAARRPRGTNPTLPAKTRRRKAVRASMLDEEYRCCDCGKLFASEGGWTYHVDRKVCQKQSAPSPAPRGVFGAVVSVGKTKRQRTTNVDNATSDDDTDKAQIPSRKRRRPLSGESSGKKGRGKLSKRKCLHCGRVFTSPLGLQYHVNKKVCQRESADASSAHVLWDTLHAGQMFVTPLGVVQVIRDDREKPSSVARARPTEKELRTVQSSAARRESLAAKTRRRQTVLSQLRRWRLQQRPTDPFRCYFGGDPRRMMHAPVENGGSTGSIASSFEPMRDPREPADSFPERIVEVAWISDERLKTLSRRDGTQLDVSAYDSAIARGEQRKLYIQRKLLTEPYDKESELFICYACGRHFGSSPGCKYHTQGDICNKTSALIEEREELAESVNSQVAHWQGRDWWPNRTPPAGPPGRKKQLGPGAVYPQVWMSLGFVMVADAPQPQTLSVDPGAKREQKIQYDRAWRAARGHAPRASGDDTAGTNEGNDQNDDPRILLARLKQELSKEQCNTLGPVYMNAWEKLGFKEPVLVLANKQRVKQRLKGRKQVKEEKFESQPAQMRHDFAAIPFVSAARSAPAFHYSRFAANPSVSDPGPIPTRDEMSGNAEGSKESGSMSVSENASEVDKAVSVPVFDPASLHHEANGGRYPSVARHDGDVKRQGRCYACKRPGRFDSPLHACDYCARSVHLVCYRMKVLIPDPEPDDDFMCSFCVQNVVARRNRAEKRRLEKVSINDALAITQAAAEAELALLQDQNGENYQRVAVQGRRLADVTALLDDATTRMAQSLESAGVNSARYNMINPNGA